MFRLFDSTFQFFTRISQDRPGTKHEFKVRDHAEVGPISISFSSEVLRHFRFLFGV